MRRALGQVLVAAALAAVVVVCLRMGWWQLQRYNSAGGSLQNLGYTLQWPTFAVFAVVMWWRLRRLERERTRAGQVADTEPPTPTPTPAPPAVTPVVAGQAVADTPAADEPDDELAAYNRYLAELNASAARRKKS